MGHPQWTVQPAAGPEVVLAQGFWNGDPTVALFVGDSDPAVLAAEQVAELTGLMVRLLGRKEEP